jgi:hypothetical protein
VKDAGHNPYSLVTEYVQARYQSSSEPLMTDTAG